MIRAKFPKYDINEDVLVSKVRVYTEENTIIWHDIELLIGPEIANFYKLFNEAVNKKTTTIYENINEKESLVNSFEIFKTWQQTDSPNIFRELYPKETLYPSTTLYPVFAPSQRVTHVEVMRGSEVIARIKPLKKTELNNVLTTVFYLDNMTANGQITSLKFYGGNSAKDSIGSGVLIGEEVFDYDKTILEILQIYRIDKKGW